MSLLADLLRYQSNTGELLVGIDKANSAILADAIEIADESARCDIECHVPPATPYVKGERNWWDLAATPFEDLDHIGQSTRYLDARGLLERHPEHKCWVSPKDPS